MLSGSPFFIKELRNDGICYSTTGFDIQVPFSTSSGLTGALQESGAPSATNKTFLPFVTTGAESTGTPTKPMEVSGVESSWTE